MSSSLYGHLHMVLFGCFAKLFQKGVSHYTQKNIAFWGVLSEKTSKIFIPPVIRRIEGLIGGYFSKVFQKIYPLRYTQKKVAFWGPCLAKKLSLSLYGDFKGVLGPLKIKVFYIKKKASARKRYPYEGLTTINFYVKIVCK